MAESVPEQYDLFIGGRTTAGQHGATQTLLDPATNEPLARTALATVEDARAAMGSAEAAFRSSGWAGDDGARRARALAGLAQRVEQHLEELARLESQNQGKTLREAKGDLLFVVRTLDYHAGLADKLEGETVPVPGTRLDYTLREPLGVTVHIAPWNFPLVLAVRSIAPALAAGNAVVLKPASLTPLTALRLAQLAVDAGVPEGILNVVVGAGGAIGEALITDPRCAAVSFTGSLEVGRRIAALAAQRFTPLTLELGGKGPVLVFPDADLDRAVKGVGWGIFGNAGQMCWAGSRLLVHAAIREAFLDRLRAFAEKLRVGPGTEPGVEMGPVVSAEQRARVLGFVDGARRAGATVLTGGVPYADGALARGNFVPPTVIDGVEPSMAVVREEVFGPVLTAQSFGSVEEALRLANDSAYGLLASVWTRELATAHTVAQRLDCGMVTINDPPSTYPQAPFAGTKQSGLGFEQGRRAIEFFTRRKNVLLHIGLPRARS